MEEQVLDSLLAQTKLIVSASCHRCTHTQTKAVFLIKLKAGLKKINHSQEKGLFISEGQVSVKLNCISSLALLEGRLWMVSVHPGSSKSGSFRLQPHQAELS